MADACPMAIVGNDEPQSATANRMGHSSGSAEIRLHRMTARWLIRELQLAWRGPGLDHTHHTDHAHGTLRPVGRIVTEDGDSVADSRSRRARA